MAKSFSPVVLTANDLTGGHSVFLTAEGWAPDIDRAMVAVIPEQADELEALGARPIPGAEVVGAYLVEVSLDTGVPVPLSRREQIRASGGPTIPVGPAAESRAA
jgi:hypothetical protein